MSLLLLIFILLLFYIMYQYFDMYELSMAEIARQQYDLDETQAQLTEQRGKLTITEQEMLAQQIKLNAAQAELEDAEEVLQQHKDELAAAQAEIAQKEAELAAQQTRLSSLSDQLGTQQTYIAGQQELLEQQQYQIEQLVGVRAQIIADLSAALHAADISVTVDAATGSIALESDILFPTGTSTLSQSGKDKIDEFLPVYLNVLFSSDYKDYISEIIIEGHTDSVGGYVMNLELSQDRATAVAAYVLSDGYRSITTAQKMLMREIARPSGRSYNDRVMTGGVEDKDASRRVVFKFRLTDEQMIANLKALLEGN